MKIVFENIGSAIEIIARLKDYNRDNWKGYRLTFDTIKRKGILWVKI